MCVCVLFGIVRVLIIYTTATFFDTNKVNVYIVCDFRRFENNIALHQDFNICLKRLYI